MSNESKKKVYVVLMEDGGIPDDPQVFADVDDWNAHGSALILEQGFGRKDGESDEDHLNAYFEVASDWAMPDEALSEEQRELKAGREDDMKHEDLVLRMWECELHENDETDREFILPSGARGWKDRLHHVYDNDREQWEAYDEIYNLAERLGFESAADAWDANPLICGGTDPADYGLAPEKDVLLIEADYAASERRMAEEFGILPDRTVEVAAEPKELSADEVIAKLQAFSVLPELVLDGCGFNFAYYGVQAGSQPPVDPELIKDVEGFLATLLGGGFSRFCNFTSDGRLRYLTNYSHNTGGVPFVGVAYLRVSDMVRWIEEEHLKEKGDE